MWGVGARHFLSRFPGEEVGLYIAASLTCLFFLKVACKA